MARLTIDGDELRQSQQTQFELDGWIDTAPFEDLVGLKIEEAVAGRAVLTVLFRVKLAMGDGFMHGGAITTLADTAVAMAIKSLLPPGTVFATTELTTRFFAPVKQGLVTATAVVRGPEGRSFFGEAGITDEFGTEVAHFSSVFRVARGQGFDD
jgi:acyl-CoA thioesterase